MVGGSRNASSPGGARASPFGAKGGGQGLLPVVLGGLVEDGGGGAAARRRARGQLFVGGGRGQPGDVIGARKVGAGLRLKKQRVGYLVLSYYPYYLLRTHLIETVVVVLVVGLQVGWGLLPPPGPARAEDGRGEGGGRG